MVDPTQMSSVHARSRAERSQADRDHRNEVVGTTVALILAPVIVAAFGIALLALIEALTGWSPELVKRLTPNDSIYIQTGFTKARVIMIAAGIGVGYIAALLIQWALHFSTPVKRTPIQEPLDATEAATSTPVAPTPTATTALSVDTAKQPAPVPATSPTRARPAPQPAERPQPRPVERPQAQSVAWSTSHRST